MDKSNNSNSNSKSDKSTEDFELMEYAKAYNVIEEKLQLEEVFAKTKLAQEHTSQIIEADRNDLSHTGSCVQKEKNILTAIHGINPNDTTEAMLASQMITAHNAAMKAFAKAESYYMKDDPHYKKIAIAQAGLANKLMRTYTMQMEALNRYRGKGQQRITVEHININEGGKAVMGNISTSNGMEG